MIIYTLVGGVFCALLTLNIWVFQIRPVQPWSARFGTLLQILGLYTFAFAIITQTEIVPRAIADDMTSPDLFVFLAGNLRVLGTFMAALSEVVDPAKTSFSPFAFLQAFAGIGLALLGFLYAIFHVIVVVPLSYVAYMLVSLPIEAITASGNDVRFAFNDQVVSVQQIVSTHATVIKNFLIAFPSLALKTGLELLASHRSRAAAIEGAQPTRWNLWWTSHARRQRTVLIGAQIALVVLLFVNVVSALMLPSLAGDGANASIGEILGAEIMTVLVICALVALIVKTRKRCRAIPKSTA